MTRSLRRRAVVAATMASMAVVGLATPAMAAAPSITFLSPVGPPQGDAGVTISARIAINGTITAPITMKVTSSRPTITETAPAGDSPQTVSFPVTLPYNGTYTATITAKGRSSGLFSSEETATQAINFVVLAPPATPTGVKTAVDAASRSVAITWTKNIEPDLIRYEVKRAKGTSNDFTVLAKPKAGETTYVDSSTAEAGGDYRYLVVAVRAGAPGNEEISSDPSALSADAVAKVPDPPPPPTTVAPPGTGTGTGAGAGAATGTGTGTASSVPANSPGALATSGSVDLSGFNALRNQTRSATPRTVPLPDPGFQGTLPFDAVEGPEDAEVSLTDEGGDLAADSQFRELGADAASDDRARTMAFFAAGLLATVLLMHVLWVKSEVKRVPLEALDPAGPSGNGWAGATPAGGRRARRGSGPAPTLEDIGAADFAPVIVAGTAGTAKRRSGPGGEADRARLGAKSRQRVSTGV